MLFCMTGCVPRTEKDVVVYSALDEDFAFPILEAFERKVDYDINVVSKFDVESTKTVGLVNQLIAEENSPRCDLFWNNEIMHTVRLQKLGLLEPHDWPVPADWPSELIASDSTWCGFAARARVLLINTKLLASDDSMPSSVGELSDPKWKENCAMARPLFGTTATHWAVMREQLGREAALAELQAIADNAVILSGNKQVAQAVSSGRVAWGLTDTDDAMIEKDMGYPVEIVFPDQQPDQPGTLRIPNTLAILKNAPHPVAAGRLADYLMTPQTEDRLAMGRSHQMPISKESKFPPAVLPAEPVRWMRADFEAAAEDWDEWANDVAAIYSQK
ncbi:extracellular solute-binding protein [Neorhodopirellula pilleata]|nr:extracellular solute-binding protein [Neorhodopirellula pilleata]